MIGLATSASREQNAYDSPLQLQLINSVRLPDQAETTLVVNLQNQSTNAVYEVEAHLDQNDFSEYSLESWRNLTRIIGKLSSGEKQTLEFTVLPKNLRDPYIEVVIEVCYEQQGQRKYARFPVEVPLTVEIGENIGIRNPYVTGEPLDPRFSSSMFFGRREILRDIVQDLMGKFQQNILVLHGERRIGKTSLLLQLRFQHLMPPFYPVFVDLQGIADTGLHNFLHELSKKIAETLKEFGLHVDLPSRRSILEGGYGSFDDFLTHVGEELHGGYMVLMLDEFEELEKRVQDNKLDRDIFSFIRSQMQHRRWLILIFAGTHKLEELSKEYFSIFFNTAIYKEITYLSDNEAEQLIRQPVASSIIYEDRAVRRIKDATMLHPYFIQLICHYLVEHVNHDGRAHINFQDVEEIMAKITKGDIGHLDYLWQHSSQAEQQLLLAISELRRPLPRVKNFSIEDIKHQIKTYGGKLSAESFWQAIESLKARDLLRFREDNRTYGITFELFERWIREKHPRGP